MPTPEELYGSPAASATAPTSTPTTGGGQTYVPPEDIYGQPTPTPNKISSALDQFKEDLPAVGGAAVAAPVFGEVGAGIGTAIAPGPGTIIGGGIGSIIGAWVGGAGGKGYQTVYKELTNAPDAPDNSYDAAVNIAKAGNEQAAWEIGGQLAARGLGKAAFYMRPKAVEGIEKLNVALQNAGGKLSAPQMSDSWLLHQMDSLTRGSMSGSGIMKAHDTLNEQALKTIENGVRQDIAKGVTQNLSGGELGNLFMDTVSGGKAGFKTAVGNMYEGLDTLIPPRVTGSVQQVGVDASGNPINKFVQQTVQPVDMAPVKQSLQPLLNQMKAINYAGESEESKGLLNALTGVDDRLSFSDAQALRSNLLDAQRRLEGNTGKTKVLGKINDVVDQITQAMDTAAANEGPAVLKKYQAIKDYANKGYTTFNNKFVNDLLAAGADNPADIGKRLGQVGNEQQIMDAKRAIRYSSVFNKDPSLSYDAVWPKMQAGYLDDVLNRNSTLKGANLPPTATQDTVQSLMKTQGSSLLQEFTDPAKQRTLKSFFTKDQRDALFTFAQTAERVQRKPEGGLSMVAKLGQGGVILGMVGGAVDAGKAAVTFIPSYVMAHMLTQPKTAKILAASLETPTKNAKAIPLISRLSAEAVKSNQAVNQQ